MSWLKSGERAQVNEPVEVFSKLEGEIREFVRRDASTTPPSAPPQQGKDSELIATHVGSLVARRRRSFLDYRGARAARDRAGRSARQEADHRHRATPELLSFEPPHPRPPRHPP